MENYKVKITDRKNGDKDVLFTFHNVGDMSAEERKAAYEAAVDKLSEVLGFAVTHEFTKQSQFAIGDRIRLLNMALAELQLERNIVQVDNWQPPTPPAQPATVKGGNRHSRRKAESEARKADKNGKSGPRAEAAASQG